MSKPSIRRSILTLVTGAVLSQAATVLAMPILARIYGPPEFGMYALFVSITTVLCVGATFQYELSIVLPRSAREGAALVGLGMRLLLVSSLVMTVIGVALAASLTGLSDGVRVLLVLGGLEVFLLASSRILGYWLTRNRSFRQLSRNRFIQALVSAIAQIIVGYLGVTSSVGLAMGLMLGQAAALVLLVVSDTSSRLRKESGTHHRWSYLLRKYWKQPALNAPQALVDSVRVNGINLVIGAVSMSALGQYSQAFRLVQVPAGLVGSAVSQVYFPDMAAAPRRDLPRLIRSSVLRSLALGFVPFALIWLLSPWFFPWFLGEEWADAGHFAQALTPWLYLNLATSPVATVFVILGKQHIGLPFAVVYALVPITVLWSLRDDLFVAVVVMSLAQTFLLLVNLALVFWLARDAATRAPRTLDVATDS